jgi:hypothetical protein
MAHVRTPIEGTPQTSPRPTPRHDVARTTCGRDFTVGHLDLEQIAYPASRVTLSTASLPNDRGGIWASLTPAEARRLAALLLAHAAAAEGEPGDANAILVD